MDATDPELPATVPGPRKPSGWWWVGHVFFGLLSGLVCYFSWRKTDKDAAVRHLLHSIWLGIAGQAAIYGIVVGVILLQA